ncbi:endoglucanase [Clostridium acetobutylicum]|uniref:Endoglucanase family 5 n=2 Tax=Clostridium acetobutylicum TaxID=1488 RepID=Q97KU1_CLOAB|nr:MULTISPECIES: glycoside hydrolase family 5 protein [Clostridium]AAK78801.1 Endoglucanase family 5 [Clostridium acetobutylicum ATCC 824]ADZ19875.1 Endoglucanase family 5 [Clostridium acetobutylicum EA 2018]AEI34705.1 endoglucanase family protein 5 [Clostridium acetobutylicum DSM 1731]AWV80519.1 glycoside hydrolase family 5 protein [Clostridium acetobutylicum]MBC2392709.1 glycoside hydrolase family 5 protein [Clostridium acetobutylicum]
MFRRLFSKVKILFLALTLLGTYLTLNLNTVVATNNTKTKTKKITSLQIVKNMKVGLDLGNSLDSPFNETDWGNPKTTKSMITKIKQAGFNTVRIPITWNSHIGPAPDYTIDNAWLDRVQEVVNYAYDNHMYVIINLHHEDSWLIPTYANKDAATAELTKLWTQISNRFKNYNDSLIFETMNEPRLIGTPEEWYGGTSEARDVVNSYNLAAVNAIRDTGAKNSSRFIMIPTYAASSDKISINGLKIPNNDKKILISLHAYIPYNFAMNVNGTSSWGSAKDKKELDSTLNAIYKKFGKKGYGVVIGEFASVNKNNENQRASLAKYYVSAAKKRSIAPIWWDNGVYSSGAKDSYGIFNRNTLRWECPKIVHALTGLKVKK